MDGMDVVHANQSGMVTVGKPLAALVFAFLLTLAMPAKAQGSPWFSDTTGGVAQDAIYCPSTGGGCRTSWGEAENAIRTATPDVGQFLYLDSVDRISSGSLRAVFRVKKQPPRNYSPSAYQLGGAGLIVQTLK